MDDTTKKNLQFQRPNNASLPSRSLTASEAIERTGAGNAVNIACLPTRLRWSDCIDLMAYSHPSSCKTAARVRRLRGGESNNLRNIKKRVINIRKA